MASFCGGAVGVLTALLVVEINNVKQQYHNRRDLVYGQAGGGVQSLVGRQVAGCR